MLFASETSIIRISDPTRYRATHDSRDSRIGPTAGASVVAADIAAYCRGRPLLARAGSRSSRWLDISRVWMCWDGNHAIIASRRLNFRSSNVRVSSDAGGSVRVPVDGHVHFHDIRTSRSDARRGRANFAAVSPENRALRGVLLLTQAAGEHVFEQLSGGTVRGGWRFEGVVAEPETVLARKNGVAIAIVCGRQVKSRNGLEVLALGTCRQFADGREIEQTLADVRGSGAMAVIPWGFGKWLGARGTRVRTVLDANGESAVSVGDNGGRLAAWGVPALVRDSERRGFRVVPGTDPFPFGGDYRRVGCVRIPGGSRRRARDAVAFVACVARVVAALAAVFRRRVRSCTLLRQSGWNAVLQPVPAEGRLDENARDLSAAVLHAAWHAVQRLLPRPRHGRAGRRDRPAHLRRGGRRRHPGRKDRTNSARAVSRTDSRRPVGQEDRARHADVPLDDRACCSGIVTPSCMRTRSRSSGVAS